MDQWRARFHKTLRAPGSNPVDMYYLRIDDGREVSLGVPHGDTETPKFVEAALRAAEVAKAAKH